MPEQSILSPLPEPDNPAALSGSAGRWRRIGDGSGDFLPADHIDHAVHPDPHDQYALKSWVLSLLLPSGVPEIVDGFFKVTAKGMFLLKEVPKGTTHPYYEMRDDGFIQLKKEIDSSITETPLFRLLNGKVVPKTEFEIAGEAHDERIRKLEDALRSALARLHALDGN